jgi:membrane protein implicated in regulation of membrane protease activity
MRAIVARICCRKTIMWIWFVVAAIALILELLTGTFFLLLVAVAAAGAGVVNWLGGELAWQLLAFSVLGIAGFFILKSSGFVKRRSGHDASRNTDVNLDIGQTVHVTDWSPMKTATVQYRGAKWQVRLDAAISGTPAPGSYRITDIDGIVFVVTPVSGPLTPSSL